MLHTYNELPVHTPLINSNKLHLDKLKSLIDVSLELSNRVSAFRFDLRFPKGHIDQSDKVITKFFESLKAQLVAKDKKTNAKGIRVYPNNLRYAWVRERDTSGSDHFHCVILINKDAYSVLGDFTKWEGNMAARIKRAWCSALGFPNTQIEGLVHFPINGTYCIDKNSPAKQQQINALYFRISYFAKNVTKVYGEGKRCFGSSRL